MGIKLRKKNNVAKVKTIRKVFPCAITAESFWADNFRF